jgi:hypothetical protein
MFDSLLPWARILSAVAALALVGWGGYVVHGWRRDAAELPRVRTAFAAYQAEAARQFRIAYTASEGYHRELRHLRAARAAAPAPVVRLCLDPPEPALVRRAAGSGGVPATAPDAGVRSAEDDRDRVPGPDIGPELFALADELDAFLAQCRGAQHLLSGRSSR